MYNTDKQKLDEIRELCEEMYECDLDCYRDVRDEKESDFTTLELLKSSLRAHISLFRLIFDIEEREEEKEKEECKV